MRRLFYNDDEFSKVFSDKLGNYRVVPPAGNWAAIRSTLLKRRRYLRIEVLKWTGYAAGSVFCLGALINYTTHNEGKQYLTEKARRFEQQAFSPAVETIADNAGKKTIVIANGNAKALTVAGKQNAGSLVNGKQASVQYYISAINTTISKLNKITGKPTSGSRVQVALVDPIPAGANKYLDAPFLSTFSEQDLIAGNDFLEDKVRALSIDSNVATPQKPVFPIIRDYSSCNRKLYLGVFADAQHTYLLSSTIIKNPNYHYRFSPGYAIGVIGGYALYPRLAVETGVISSNENQNYSSSEVSKRANKPAIVQAMWAELNYVRVPLILKYKFRTSSVNTVCDESINLIGGFQYGRFLNGETFNGTTTYKLDNSYIKANDFQFVTGVERTKAISKHFVYNLGLKFVYSSSQISATYAKRLNDIYKPHNLTSGITLSIAYR